MASTPFNSTLDATALAQRLDGNRLAPCPRRLPIRLKRASSRKQHSLDWPIPYWARRTLLLHPQLPLRRRQSRGDIFTFVLSSADDLLAQQKQEVIDSPPFPASLFDVLDIPNLLGLVTLTLGSTLQGSCSPGVVRVKPPKPTLSPVLTTFPPPPAERAKNSGLERRCKKSYKPHCCGGEPVDTGYPPKRKRSGNEPNESANSHFAGSNAAGANSSVNAQFGHGRNEQDVNAPKLDYRPKMKHKKTPKRALKCLVLAVLDECPMGCTDTHQGSPSLSHALEHLFLLGVHCEVCGLKFRNRKPYIGHDPNQCQGPLTQIDPNTLRWPGSRHPPRHSLIEIAQSQPHSRANFLHRHHDDGLKWIYSFCWLAELYGKTKDIPEPYITTEVTPAPLTNDAPELAQGMVFPGNLSGSAGNVTGWQSLGLVPDHTRPTPSTATGNQLHPPPAPHLARALGHAISANSTGNNPAFQNVTEPYTFTSSGVPPYRADSFSTTSLPNYSYAGSSNNDTDFQSPADMRRLFTNNTMSSIDQSIFSPSSSGHQYTQNMAGQPSNLTDGAGGINLSSTGSRQGVYSAPQPPLAQSEDEGDFPWLDSLLDGVDQTGTRFAEDYSGQPMQSMPTHSLNHDVDHSHESLQLGPATMIPAGSSTLNQHSSGSIPLTEGPSRPFRLNAAAILSRHQELLSAVGRMHDTILSCENDILALTGVMPFPGVGSQVPNHYANMSFEGMTRALETYRSVFARFREQVQIASRALGRSSSNVQRPT